MLSSKLAPKFTYGPRPDLDCFQTDLAFRTHRQGLRLAEVPIEFVERVRGESKMDRSVATESLSRITVWGVQERRRQLHRLLGRTSARSA